MSSWIDFAYRSVISRLVLPSSLTTEVSAQPCHDYKEAMGLFRAKAGLVCYTAVFSVVPQRSSPQTAAENRTTFLSLCVCGLTNNHV